MGKRPPLRYRGAKVADRRNHDARKAKLCASCGKPLLRPPTQAEKAWEKRKYCNRVCAGKGKSSKQRRWRATWRKASGRGRTTDATSLLALVRKVSDRLDAEACKRAKMLATPAILELEDE